MVSEVISCLNSPVSAWQWSRSYLPFKRNVLLPSSKQYHCQDEGSRQIGKTEKRLHLAFASGSISLCDWFVCFIDPDNDTLHNELLFKLFRSQTNKLSILLLLLLLADRNNCGWTEFSTMNLQHLVYHMWYARLKFRIIELCPIIVKDNSTTMQCAKHIFFARKSCKTRP